MSTANYELERRLADRLRSASQPERRSGLYAAVYDEYFTGAVDVPHTDHSAREIARQARLVTRFLPASGRYVEIGAGTCEVAQLVARDASAVTTVEVSEVVAGDGVGVVIGDGVTVPINDDDADMVYSNQLLEHLHPDDMADHLQEVRRVLAPGGAFLAITPNRLNGPHDVSRHYSDTPQGFHLNELSITDTVRHLRRAGFQRVRIGVFLGGEVLLLLPPVVFRAVEFVASLMPKSVRSRQPMKKALSPGGVVAWA